MAEPLLQVENLNIDIKLDHVVYPVVSDLSFRVDRGETLCIVGESGCGKSISILSLVGLNSGSALRVRSGKAKFGSRDLFSLKAREIRQIRGKEIGIVFQEPMSSLNPVVSVGEQVAEAFRLHSSASRREAKEKAISLLRKVGVPDPEIRYQNFPHELSGGLRQRVMIAMSIINEPSLLIADEPTTALDVTIQSQILALIEELKSQNLMGLILVTHDLGVVAQVADRVSVMYAGVEVESGPVQEIFDRPLHPYTQALMKSIPKFKSSPNYKKLETIEGQVPSITKFPAHCRFFDRCPHADETCAEAMPPLEAHTARHLVRCLKYQEWL